MQIVRTVVWVLTLVAVLLFTLGNWDQQVTVRIWENLVWDTRLPAVVIVSFLLGMLPMWMIARGTSWRLNRRIGHLEQATRNIAAPPPPPATTPPSNPAPTQETDPSLRSE
ncbi:LapA family protein [Altererythrobacter sp. MF3-039]|uniref:LapA family protein n=1 Tax=Altererythrobacter sp. MF3-039 TaxID=3252901 RepID=UPI00390C965D